MTAVIISAAACESIIPVYPATRQRMARTMKNMIPCLLIERMKDPRAFPADWKMIIRRRDGRNVK